MDIINYLTTIQFGAGSLDSLPGAMGDLGIKRPLIVSDHGIASTGLLDRLTALVPAGSATFLDVPSNPTESAVEAACAVYRTSQCDGIIAFGGGSPIDLAKGVALLTTHPGKLEQYAAILGGIPRISNAVAPLIAIPTTAGTVRVGDVDLTAAKPGARVSAGLVSVPNYRGLFPSLSVAEHFRLIGSSVDEAAALFPGLAKLAGRRVGACSGGEQQQVAVGLGMVRRPKVLCVDELSMGLAPQVAGELLAGLRTLADEGDTAVIVVEQFVDAVLAVADRGLVLSEGRVTHDEPAAALLADHASLEAAYLG